MNVASLKSRRALLIISLLGATILMVAGHAKIIATGDNECGRGVPYDLVWHYVSDFAKHPEHGWIIKTAIGLFCICIAVVLWDYSAAMSVGGHSHRLAWLVFLGVVMIGGLTMVALYDNRSMTWYAKGQDYVYKAYQDLGFPEWAFVRKLLGRPDADENFLHDVGFGVFATGFLLLVVTAAWIKRDNGQGLAKKTLTFLVVTTLLIAWACIFDEYMPGIPQRTLLVAIAGWLLVSHFRYGSLLSTNASLDVKIYS